MPVSSQRQQKNEEKKDLTRIRLLSAAESLFAAKGYHNTIISDIVREAGVGQGTFYRNFKDKSDIFEVLIESLVIKLFAEFDEMKSELPANAAEYRQASISAIKRMARTVEANRQLVRIFFREAVSVDQRIEAKIAEIVERFASLAGFYLDHAIRSGYARPCQSAVVSRAIVGLGYSMINLWMSGRFVGLEIDHFIEELVDFAFHGLVGAQVPTSDPQGVNHEKS
jgi:AcrR family transcriptional regulator